MKTRATTARDALTAALSLLALVMIAVAVYRAGLTGPFVFDDFATLPALGALGGVDNPVELWRYLTTGITGPTGRPLSLLSFLLDDTGWPSSPERFKYTSLMCHLLSSVAVFWLLFALENRVLGSTSRQSVLIAAIAGALWSVNPCFSSTVLYIVQRMTMLSALFVLFGLIGFVYSRTRLREMPLIAYIGMSAALTLGTGIGVLAKENAALLPVLALTLECLLFRHQEARFARLHAVWVSVFMLGPVLFASVYIALNWSVHAQSYLVLGMEPWQRLLTECRVLFAYLQQLLIPQFAAGTVFHDGFAVSRSLVQPISTLIAVLALSAVLILVWAKYKQWPRLCTALAFFLVGHSLEAGVLPLELYFEHRNYLPAALLFWCLAAGLINRSLPASHLAVPAVLVYAALFPLATHMQARVWGSDSDDLHLYWAQRFPESPRAQRLGAIELVTQNRLEDAISLVQASLQRHPAHMPTRLHLLLLQCNAGLDRGSVEEAINRAQVDFVDFRGFKILLTFVENLSAGQCPGTLPASDTERFLNALDTNPSTLASAAGAAHIAHLRGRAGLQQQNLPLAIHSFEQALEREPSVDIGLTQIGLLAGAGALEPALQHLQVVRGLIKGAQRSNAGLTARELTMEIDRLERLLAEELASEAER